MLALAVTSHAATILDWTFNNVNDSILESTSATGSWTLYENGSSFNGYFKGTVSDGGAGHPPVAPWLTSSIRVGSSGKALAYRIPSTGAINNSQSDKLSHRLISGSNTQAPSFTTGRAVGFSVQFGDGTASSFASVAERLLFFQIWQGSGAGSANPPFFLDIKPYNGNGSQVVRVRAKNDNNSQSNDSDVTAVDEFTVARDTWHRIEIEFKPSYVGQTANGYVKIWLNGTQVTNWTGKNWGYKPTSAGGSAGFNDRFDIHTLLYRARQDREHRIFFDNVKYGTTRADVQ
jgi:Polysaccharide lyase